MNTEAGGPVVHEAFGAGRWFPAGETALRTMVMDALDVVLPPLDGPVAAGISPHAGYVYSGRIAGHTFRALRDQAGPAGLDTLVVLGSSHGHAPPGVSVLDADVFRTPLGDAVLDRGMAEALVSGSRCIRLDSGPHCGEHSAENQVPFAQVAMPGVALVVALMGNAAPETVDELVDRLVELSSGGRVSLVASTDMLHDADYDLVSKTDRNTLGMLTRLDSAGLRAAWSYHRQLVCGLGPVLTAMRYAERLGCRAGVELCYRNSGDDHPESRGQWVVGYGSVVFVLTP